MEASVDLADAGLLSIDLMTWDSVGTNEPGRRYLRKGNNTISEYDLIAQS
jgi:hypothetical protein